MSERHGQLSCRLLKAFPGIVYVVHPEPTYDQDRDAAEFRDTLRNCHRSSERRMFGNMLSQVFRCSVPSDEKSIEHRDGTARSDCCIRCRNRVVWVVVALLAIQAGLLVWSAWQHSPTLNEPAHLVAGISHWQLGRFELYRVNPPLVSMVAALPVLAAGCETDWSGFYDGPGARPVFSIGEDFITTNGERSLWLMTLARWSCIPFSLIGGLVCFLWARELFGCGKGDRLPKTGSTDDATDEERAHASRFSHRGTLAGLVALTLWCFDPNVLGHGQLITPDVPAASLGALAAYLFWRWLQRPDWSRAFAAGLALGLAELTKMTWLVLFPLWPVLWLICRGIAAHRKTDEHRRPSSACQPAKSADAAASPRFTQLASILVLGLYILNLGYGFDGTFTTLKDFTFVSQTLGGDTTAGNARGGNRFSDSWLGEVFIPLPKQYVLGMDVQKQDFEDYAWPSYLRGEWKKDGWWYYYLYGLAVKVPLGTQLLFLIATVLVALLADRSAAGINNSRSLLWDTRLWTLDSLLVLLAPAVVVLILVSSQTGFNHHLRYVLPVLPFTFIYISQVSHLLVASKLRRTDCQSVKQARPPREQDRLRSARSVPVAFSVAIVTCLAGTLLSSLYVYPHSLSYFNELVGGPRNGHKHLLHSSLDWGQDLIYVKEWLVKHPDVRSFYLAYYGAFEPHDIGIDYELPPQKPNERDAQTWLKHVPPGWYGISVNYLCGDQRAAPNGDGGKKSVRKDAFTAFQSLEPDTILGSSIWLFHVE